MVEQDATVEATAPIDATADGPDWPAYYRHSAGREPRPLFTRGMAAVDAAGVAPGQAVEVGFGDGTETLTLLAAGWRVFAVDPTPTAAASLRERTSPELAKRLTIETAAAEAVQLPPFDLLYAGYAMSFVDPSAFPSFWTRVRAAVRPGGFLVVNVFGVNDTWADDPLMTFLDRERAMALVDGLEVLAFDESDADGDSFSGPKHWHIFEVVARASVRPSR